ncbi:MFS transporter [Pseudorhodoferax sp. Leaf265]|jgi:predicted MFS family arabinose efflux permease|uniref:MFS transporter n=1 Tax=Pseudorhodoferax sp. Leaf265 TaxID=1736315 RepID=UPI0006FC63A4|nr:MFS transporter [Pseudorhodoferax sp. Leaf265]KQP04269.1 MFS transporter [Pseudorhodoferax sp. Leaf265]
MQTMNMKTEGVPALPAPLLGLLATGAGMSVAALYYSQPMLGRMAADLQTTPSAAGAVPTLTQLGYALGIALLAPLGDRFDRRVIILVKAAVLAAMLLATAAAPSLHLLLATSLAIGLAATLAQDIVPAAATLAPAAERGKAVGTVMTGLLLGILLSRVVSGFVAEHWHWRAVYAGAAVGVAAVGLAAWRLLPRFAATTQLGYGALLASLAQLWRKHPALRRATAAQALLSVGFSAFWSTLAVMLQAAPFHIGASVAGAFGLAGAAGALAAPLAGRLADRSGPGRVARLGAGLAAVSFVAMGLGASLPVAAQLVLLALGAVAFDLGVQATLVAHQSIVYGIDPAARSRLNAVLLTGMFVGMAVGSALGATLLAHAGWAAVMALAAAASGLAWWLRR